MSNAKKGHMNIAWFVAIQLHDSIDRWITLTLRRLRESITDSLFS
jgi:hypothetical protein